MLITFFLQVELLESAEVFLKINKPLTLKQALFCDRSTYYQQKLVLTGLSVVVDGRGISLIIHLPCVLPENLVYGLEQVCADLRKVIPTNSVDTEIGSKSRGLHKSIRFGSIVQRGGSGQICISKNNTKMKEFISSNQGLWDFVSDLFSKLCVDEADIMRKVPEKHRVFGLFGAAYWNISNVSVLHRDHRDWRWCVAIAFGEFESGALDFPVINTMVYGRRLGLVFFWSKKLFHNVIDVIGDRQSVVLTNHTAVVRRFVPEIDDKRYSHK